MSNSTKKLTTEEWVKKAGIVHNGKYDYSKVDYINSRTNVTIICITHGEFSQNVGRHMFGQNCPKCAREKVARTAGDRCRQSKEEWVSKVKKVHGDRYDYSKVVYKSTKDKVLIVCKEHGEFYQTAGNHYAGNGCPTCGLHMEKHGRRCTKEEFIEKAKKTHGTRYTYTEKSFTRLSEPVYVICKDHGEFKCSDAYGHLYGQGCPRCRKFTGGFDTSKSAILYYLRVETPESKAYKIGITNRSVIDRYRASEERKRITVVAEWQYASGEDAKNREQHILHEYKKYSWKGPNLLKDGNTELFDRDVLSLDEGSMYE